MLFSGPYFAIFGLNKQIYRTKIHIQSEYGKGICEAFILRYILRQTNHCLTQILNLRLSKLSSVERSKLIKILIDQSRKGVIVQLLETLKNLLTPQNERRHGFSMRVLRYEYHSDNLKCPKYTFFVSFLSLIIFHIRRTIYHIKLADLSK